MKTSVGFIIYLATAGVSLQNVTGNRGRPAVSCVNSDVTRMVRPGESVTVSCKYPPAEGGTIKQLCREDETSQCTNLISAQTVSHTMKDRFSLRDDKQRGVFNVTISTVTETDGGRYKCVLESVSTGNFTTQCLTKIQLTVSAERDIKTKTPPPDDAPLNKGIVVGVVVCLVLLMTGTLVLLLARTKVCCPVGESNAGRQTEGNHRHNYEEIQLLEQQATSGAALHSAYATAGHPTNQFHHQRLSSNDSELCDANKNSSSAPDCSSVNGTAAHPPAVEQTMYSTLKMSTEP